MQLYVILFSNLIHHNNSYHSWDTKRPFEHHRAAGFNKIKARLTHLRQVPLTPDRLKLLRCLCCLYLYQRITGTVQTCDSLTRHAARRRYCQAAAMQKPISCIALQNKSLYDKTIFPLLCVP